MARPIIFGTSPCVHPLVPFSSRRSPVFRSTILPGGTRGALVDSTTWRQITTATTLHDGSSNGYGYGWYVDKYKEHRRLKHHGETSGFTNAYQRYPDDGLSIIVLTNRSGTTPWDIAERVADIYFQQSRATPEP